MCTAVNAPVIVLLHKLKIRIDHLKLVYKENTLKYWSHDQIKKRISQAPKH